MLFITWQFSDTRRALSRMRVSQDWTFELYVICSRYMAHTDTLAHI